MSSTVAGTIYAAPPAWKCIAAAATAVGLSFIAYEIIPTYSKPISCSPAWQTASWMRSWNKEREAGDPVILNPFRKGIPPHVKNLEDMERLSEGQLKLPENTGMLLAV